MPPTGVHLTGSVNLAHTEAVFRELAARVGDLAPAYPDGETGECASWVLFRLRHLRAVDGLDFGDLGDAGAYIANYEILCRLRAEHHRPGTQPLAGLVPDLTAVPHSVQPRRGPPARRPPATPARSAWPERRAFGGVAVRVGQ